MSDVLEPRNLGTFFWDGTFPDSLTTVDGYPAIFSTSVGGTQANLNRRGCKFSVQLQYSDGSTEEADVGTFLIETVQTDADSGTGTVNLTSLIQPMMEADADKVKNGQSWYQNRHVSFLINELIKSVYSEPETGQIPDNFIISSSDIATSDGAYTLSSFGRPPEYDGKGFLDLGLTCRALAKGDVGQGTYLYMGCDDELWKYDETQDLYHKIGVIGNKSGYQIRELIVHNSGLYGAAFIPTVDNLVNDSFPLTSDMIVFSYSDAAGLVELAKIPGVWTGEWQLRRGTTYSYIPLGTITYRYASVIGTPYLRWSPVNRYLYYHTRDSGENIPIPFAGKVVVGITYANATYPRDPNAMETNQGFYTVCSPSVYKNTGTYSPGEMLNYGWNGDKENAPYWITDQIGGVYTYNLADQSDTRSGKLSPDGPGWAAMSVGDGGHMTDSSPRKPRIFARHALGNRATMCFFKSFADTHNHLALLYFQLSNRDVNGGFPLFTQTTQESGFTPQIDLCAYDFNTNLAWTVIPNMTDNSLPFQPSCIFVNDSGYGEGNFEIFIGGMAWDEADNTSNTSFSCFRSYKMAANGREITAVNTYSARSLNTIVGGCYNNNIAPNPILLCYFDRSKMDDPDQYTLAAISGDVPDLPGTLILNSPYMLGNFVAGSGGSELIYFLNYRDKNGSGGNCQLWGYDGSGPTAAVLDDGRSVVTGETNASSPIALTSNSDGNLMIYCVSAPYFPQNLQGLKSVGRYWLWKYDNRIANRIELADFSELKVWDALTLLANATRSYVGFDLDTFIFVPRAYETTPLVVFDADTDPYVDLTKIQDKDIRNIVRATPYNPKLGDIEWAVNLITKEGVAAPVNTWSGELGINQKDTLTRNIRMRCVKSGAITPSSSLTNTTTCRFGYLVHEPLIEVKNLRECSASDTRLFLANIFDDIKFGDYLIISDPTTKVEVSRRVTNISSNYRYIEVNLAFGFYIPSLTPITVVPVASTISSTSTPQPNRFSDEGITYVIGLNYTDGQWGISSGSFFCHSGRNMGAGTILTFGDKMKEFEVEQTSKNGGGGYWEVSVKPLSGYILTGDIAINDVVRAFFRPAKSDSYALIGGTNTEVAFFPENSSDATKSYFNSEYYDTITVTCPGLTLEGDEQSKYSAVDITSIALFGRREYSIPDNRFIHHALVSEWVRRELQSSSNPRLLIDLTVNLINRSVGLTTSGFERIPFVNSSSKKLNIIRVYHRGLFKNWPGFYVDGYVIGQSFNPKTFQQKFQLRSVLPF